MKNKFNSIEEYCSYHKAKLKKDWEDEIRLYQNWLDGHRSRAMVGFLADRHTMTEEYARERLAYANEVLSNLDYIVRKYSYSYKKPMPKKDNDSSFVCNGTWWANSSKTRVPSLKRKGAWKKFYKMFPDLKGMKSINGSPCSVYHGLNKSTIKLKKAKK